MKRDIMARAALGKSNMRLQWSISRRILAVVLVITPAIASSRGDQIEMRVQTGASPRTETPLKVELNWDLLGKDGTARLKQGPRGVSLRELSPRGEPIGQPFLGQLDLSDDAAEPDTPTLKFLLHGTTPADRERVFMFDPDSSERVESPWSFNDHPSSRLDLSYRGKSVFRYNMSPRSNPKYPEIPSRNAYLHPVYTPSGGLITGDFTKSHPHHRGIFLAYTKTLVGELQPDFWNYHVGTGTIRFEHLDAAVVGPVTASFRAQHRWEAVGYDDVMKETWELEIHDVPGSPFWLMDLTSRQRAIEKPIDLIPYRYGGMAYRGPEPFYHGKIDVLTSEGFDRVSGDQMPARWVDLTGPVEEGSTRFGGAMILDHPSNPHYPTVARIHPTTIPFFTYTPAHDTNLTIGTAADTTFRYRIVIHDGHPDRLLNERLWNDFSSPPVVTVTRKAR